MCVRMYHLLLYSIVGVLYDSYRLTWDCAFQRQSELFVYLYFNTLLHSENMIMNIYSSYLQQLLHTFVSNT